MPDNRLPNDGWLLPDGIEEILPDEAARLEAMRRDVLDLFGTWGYRLVVTPLIEFIDSLLTGTGHDLDIQTFKLIDQHSGRLLGVRADMTPQVARIDARYSEPGVPARLCYLGTVLHTNSDRLETSRSPMQVGAELYGHSGMASDLEIIGLALEMLAIAGVQGVHLDLGHVGIYRALAESAGLDSSLESQLFEILQCKAKPDLRELLTCVPIDAAAADRLTGLMDLNGGVEVLEVARSRLSGAGAGVDAAIDELASVASVLRTRFPLLPIHFDLAELRGYHYHTGIIFAAFVPGYGREIARGGRYDDIGRVFGSGRPATGFSADLRALLRLGSGSSAPEDTGRSACIFAPADGDEQLQQTIRDLRARGRAVIQQLPGQCAQAEQMGCKLQLVKREGLWITVPLMAVASEHIEN